MFLPPAPGSVKKWEERGEKGGRRSEYGGNFRKNIKKNKFYLSVSGIMPIFAPKFGPLVGFCAELM